MCFDGGYSMEESQVKAAAKRANSDARGQQTDVGRVGVEAVTAGLSTSRGACQVETLCEILYGKSSLADEQPGASSSARSVSESWSLRWWSSAETAMQCRSGCGRRRGGGREREEGENAVVRGEKRGGKWVVVAMVGEIGRRGAEL